MSKPNEIDLAGIVERRRAETLHLPASTPDTVLGRDMLDKSLDLADYLRVSDSEEDD